MLAVFAVVCVNAFAQGKRYSPADWLKRYETMIAKYEYALRWKSQDYDVSEEGVKANEDRVMDLGYGRGYRDWTDEHEKKYLALKKRGDVAIAELRKLQVEANNVSDEDESEFDSMLRNNPNWNTLSEE